MLHKRPLHKSGLEIVQEGVQSVANSIIPHQNRSVGFWVLTISCLGYALVMSFCAVYFYYQVYLGNSMKVLSESMGANEYKNFLSETLGTNAMVLGLISLIAFTFSMLLLIKEKYSQAKALLVVVVVCATFNSISAFARFDIPFTITNVIPWFYPLGIIGALFWYIHKYQN